MWELQLENTNVVNFKKLEQCCLAFEKKCILFSFVFLKNWHISRFYMFRVVLASQQNSVKGRHVPHAPGTMDESILTHYHRSLCHAVSHWPCTFSGFLLLLLLWYAQFLFYFILIYLTKNVWWLPITVAYRIVLPPKHPLCSTYLFLPSLKPLQPLNLKSP